MFVQHRLGATWTRHYARLAVGTSVFVALGKTFIGLPHLSKVTSVLPRHARVGILNTALICIPLKALLYGFISPLYVPWVLLCLASKPEWVLSGMFDQLLDRNSLRYQFFPTATLYYNTPARP